MPNIDILAAAQRSTNAELGFVGIPTDLEPRSFEVRDAMDAIFELSIECRSPRPDLDLEDLVGRRAWFRVEGGPRGNRTWTGIATEVSLVRVEPTGISTYSVRVASELWLLTQRRNHRIFQHKSAADIAVELGREWGFSVEGDLSSASRWELRIQNGESDFAFLSRILEEAGLGYFLRCRVDGGPDGGRQTSSTMVLVTHSDAVECPLPGALRVVDTPELAAAGEMFAANVSLPVELRPGRAVIADFDFRTPTFRREFRAERGLDRERPLESYVFAPGSGRMDSENTGDGSETPVADAESVGRVDEETGNAWARGALASLRASRAAVHLTTNALSIGAGDGLFLLGHPKPDVAADRKLVVTGYCLQGEVGAEWDVTLSAMFAQGPLGVARKTPKPAADGPQIAYVVGPAGEEIHIDEHGRVRVWFPWDRSEEAPERRMAWVRVAQGWAGPQLGVGAHPRVGDEVLIDFTDGNIDEPVVVGRLHSPLAPSPHALPGRRTRTAVRAHSSPNGAAHQELFFEDEVGLEDLQVRAGRDLQLRVGLDREDLVEHDVRLAVGRNSTRDISKVESIEAGGRVIRMAKITEKERLANGAEPSIEGLDTKREMLPERITITTGGASIQLLGPDIFIAAENDLTIRGKEVSIQGGPYVHLNPPPLSPPGGAAAVVQPANVVTYKLASADGMPLADVTTHLTLPDGTTSTLRTDGHGTVRIPVDASKGSFKLTAGAPAPVPAASQASAPSQAAAPAAGGASANATATPATATPTATPVVAQARSFEIGSTPRQKARKARPTKHQLPIELKVISPVAGARLEIAPGGYPTPAPSMPTIDLEAQVLVQGEPVQTGTLRWELSIRGTYRVRHERSYRRQRYQFAAGTVETRPGEKLSYQLSPAELVGGELVVKVQYDGGRELGDIKATQTIEGLRVFGGNPARADVEAMIAALGGTRTWVLLRIFCHESVHRLEQFEGDDILYGPPSGVGTVQRDPEAPEWVWPADRVTMPNNFFPRIFWNWHENVREGISSFETTYVSRGRRDLERTRSETPSLPEPTEAILMRASIRRYNGGIEYGTNGTQYMVAPRVTNNPGYVNSVLSDPHVDAATYPVPADALAAAWPVAHIPLPRRRPGG